jgi:hypothetical protein
VTFECTECGSIAAIIAMPAPTEHGGCHAG